MYFQVTCPKCEKNLKIREELSGRRCACPHCKNTMQIPPLSRLGSAEQDNGLQINTKRKPSSNPTSTPPLPSTSPADNGPFEDSTNVSIPTSFVIGIVCTIIFYAALLPLRGKDVFKQIPLEDNKAAATAKMKPGETTTKPPSNGLKSKTKKVANGRERSYFYDLFWDRGWVQYVSVALFFWSLAILFLKWKKMKVQKDAMLLDVLPEELSPQITFESLDRFLSHIHKLPVNSQSFLINRVVRGIEHFRVRKSTAETVTMMGSQSEIDANNVFGSYTLIKVFIWALPIMGFIGTVLGVSDAIGGLAGSLQNSSDMEAVKASLQNVFGGLGSAFDTTLLALVLSLAIKVPCSAMQKSEEDLITWVDEYCNENLLKRLDDKREGGAQRIGGAGASGVDPDVIRDIFAQAMGVYHDEWNKQITAMSLATREMQKSFAAITAQTEKIQVDSMKANKTLQNHFTGLERGLTGLSTVLTKLGEEQVVIQQVTQKRSWFG